MGNCCKDTSEEQTPLEITVPLFAGYRADQWGIISNGVKGIDGDILSALIFCYQEQEIVYNLELDSHRPFVLQEQDSLETQSSLSNIFLIENREMPILYNPLAFGGKSLQQSWKVFVCRYLPTNKLTFLCVLYDSAVKANNFMLFLITSNE